MEKLAIASAILAWSSIADADDLRVWMLVRLAQQVAHVHVLEADADDAPFSHLSSSHTVFIVGLRGSIVSASRPRTACFAAPLLDAQHQAIATASVADSDLNPEKLSSTTST